MKNYYICLQDGSLKEWVWLNIPADNEEKAWNIAAHFYRFECDCSNEDLIAMCLMETPRDER